MLLGIDHVIVAVRELDRASSELEREVGLRTVEGGRHDAHGTHNRLAWLGDSYIELMAVFDEQRAAASWWGRQAVAVSRRGGGAMGLALASDDVAADAQRLRAMGSTVSEPVDGERRRPDGELVRWRIARLPQPDPDIGLIFLIEHDETAAEWRPDERRARALETQPAGTPVRLLRVELPVGAVRPLTQQLLRLLGLQFRPSLAGGGARETSIGGQSLRLIRGTAEAAATIELLGGTQAHEIDALGCRWRLQPAGGG